jgi:cyanophycinase
MDAVRDAATAAASTRAGARIGRIVGCSHARADRANRTGPIHRMRRHDPSGMMSGVHEGPLALVGGDELRPGNEPHDRVLVDAAGDGPAFVLATAAARQGASIAVENARRWFGSLGLEVEELPATRRSHVTDEANARRARSGRFFYLVGGDPGLVPSRLAGTPLWRAIVDAWLDGAALAGSSAGAMALGEWTLIRDRHPGDVRRRYAPALGVVPRIAVVPHLSTFGRGWIDPALAAAPRSDAVLLGLDERTAALWRDGVWRVSGDGGVDVIGADDRHRFGAGDALDGVPDPALGD